MFVPLQFCDAADLDRQVSCHTCSLSLMILANRCKTQISWRWPVQWDKAITLSHQIMH